MLRNWNELWIFISETGKVRFSVASQAWVTRLVSENTTMGSHQERAAELFLYLTAFRLPRDLRAVRQGEGEGVLLYFLGFHLLINPAGILCSAVPRRTCARVCKGDGLLPLPSAALTAFRVRRRTR